MTPKERLALAMELTVPDRVPVMCQMSIGHMLIRTGHSPSEFWHWAASIAPGTPRENVLILLQAAEESRVIPQG